MRNSFPIFIFPGEEGHLCDRLPRVGGEAEPYHISAEGARGGQGGQVEYLDRGLYAMPREL